MERERERDARPGDVLRRTREAGADLREEHVRRPVRVRAFQERDFVRGSAAVKVTDTQERVLRSRNSGGTFVGPSAAAAAAWAVREGWDGTAVAAAVAASVLGEAGSREGESAGMRAPCWRKGSSQ
jgi:hypothetical protein